MTVKWKRGAVVCLEVQRAEIINLISALSVYVQEYEGVADTVKILRMNDLIEEFEGALDLVNPL